MRYRIAVGGCELRRREEPVIALRDRVDAVGTVRRPWKTRQEQN